MRRSLLLISIILICGCTQSTELTYERNGTSYVVETYPSLNPAMEWVRNNTPENATFLNWWDYGHSIRGVGEREAIIFNPSREILNTVSKYASLSQEELSTIECPDCNPHERIMDVVNALSTNDSSVTISLMDEYSSEYVLVTSTDKDLLFVLGIISNSSLGEETILSRMVDQEEIQGFVLEYSDESAVIYRKR